VVPEEERFTRAELASLVDVDQLRDLLAPITARGDRVSRSYAAYVAGRRGFPEPLIDHPRLRLWLRRDVDAWIAHERERRDAR